MRRSRAIAKACKVFAGVVCATVTGLAFVTPASAYCRTSVCNHKETAAVCMPAQPSDCGIPLYWPMPCVGYSIHEAASTQVTLAQAEGVFEAAFAAWTGADCGSGTQPRIQVSYAGPVTCNAHEYNQDKGNANIIAFRDAEWPHPGGSNTLALTTVTYNLDTGEIYDADMEINTADVTFTLGDTNVQFDLLSVATHEAGHFLGIAHSGDMTATMYAEYVPGSPETPGSQNLRDLANDDIAAICAAYPSGEPISNCDPTPRHGFSSLCAAQQVPPEAGGCCVIAAGGPPRSQGGLLVAALLSLGAVLRRIVVRTKR